jgi:hypothetical protein
VLAAELAGDGLDFGARVHLAAAKASARSWPSGKKRRA